MTNPIPQAQPPEAESQTTSDTTVKANPLASAQTASRSARSTVQSVLRKYVRIARGQWSFFGDLTVEERGQQFVFVLPNLSLPERLYALLLALLQAPSLSRDIQVIDDALLIGRALIAICLEEPSLVEPFTSESLPPLTLLDNASRQNAQNVIAFLRHMGPLHQVRFWHSRDLKDLRIAQGLTQICISAVVNDSVEVDESFMCMILLDEFAVTLDPETISSAILHGRGSLRGIYHDNPQHLAQLATALGQRYLHFSTEEDVDNSIVLLLSAIASAEKRRWPESKLGRLRLKLNITVNMKFGLTSSLGSTSCGMSRVDILRGLLAQSPAGSTQTRLYQLMLAQALTSNSSEGDPDFDEAIAMYDLALAGGVAELDPQSIALGRFALSECMVKRYELDGTVEDLDKSESIMLGMLQDDSTGISVYKGDLRARLCSVYMKRYKHLRRPKDLKMCERMAAEMTHGGCVSTQMQLTVATFCAENYASEGLLLEAINHYRKALDLHSRFSMTGRDHRVEPFIFGFAGRAAATAAACGKSCEALELLECGRLIEWNRALRMRTPLDKLQDEHPLCANEFREASDALEKEEWSKDDLNSTSNAVTQMGWAPAPWESRFTLSQRWDAIVSKIQSLPGYEHFLASPTYDQLQHASDEGPVVVVNVCLYLSHAFILAGSTQDRPQIVPLPNTLCLDVIQWVHALLEGLEKLQVGCITEPTFGRTVLKPIVCHLWEEVVQPIRQTLKPLAPYARRIWWCPVGPLTFLPLHLATNDFDTADGYLSLIPSMVPTLSSLLRARSIRSSFNVWDQPMQKTLLAVCCEQPQDTAHEKIPGTRQEIKIVQKLAGQHTTTILDGEKATTESVLRAMSTHSWLHLACHGVQLAEAPLESHFALFDGVLRMSDIASRKLDLPTEFAFLSACETAAGVTKMADEAMHLAACFQFLGYRGIVATMWSVHDGTAKKLAKGFYARLFRDSGGAPHAEDTAEALWKATDKLREEGVPLSRLAPFIHLGV